MTDDSFRTFRPTISLDLFEAVASEVARLRGGLHGLYSEVDCRIEHGAESGGHLEYVRGRLEALLAKDEDSA